MVIETLEHVIIALETAFREGADEDIPEGTRYIKLSETMVNQMIAALNNIGNSMKIEYELVIYAAYNSDEAIDNFIDSVNEKLTQGWALQGGISCYPISDCKECIFFAQAIIRRKDDDAS